VVETQAIHSGVVDFAAKTVWPQYFLFTSTLVVEAGIEVTEDDPRSSVAHTVKPCGEVVVEVLPLRCLSSLLGGESVEHIELAVLQL